MEAESPLIGDHNNLSLLLDEFANNPGFYIKLQNLCNKYDKYRKTRRDGSCFYRALAFSIFEQIYTKNDKALKEKMIKKLKDSK
jgi:ubiquitin thioesterase protein OTUB1